MRSTTRACTGARRLADGCGCFAEGAIQCRYHGVVIRARRPSDRGSRRDEFTGLPEGLTLATVRADTWGGFVFVNLDPGAEPLLEFLDPLPTLLAPYRLEDMRLRASLSTMIHANWKSVVDAFNEGYHVQGTAPADPRRGPTT